MIDAITLTVLQNRFRQIAEEMDIIFDRAAFSPIISEGRDRACGIYRRESGRLIAQGSTGMPIHIGAMQFAVSSIVENRREHRPGDIYMTNCPYLGGTHLMDVKLVMPVFHDGKLFCFLGSSGHWPDIGGAAPGGYVTKATEVQQEGLRVAGIKLYRDGEVEPDLLRLILDNVRVPTQRLGDLHAQVASLKAGEAEVHRLIAAYGADRLDAAIEQLERRAARLVREKIAQLKPGKYSFEDMMDNDGVQNEPLHIRLDMEIKPDRIVFDFSRSSKPCRGPLNSVIATTASAVYISFKHAFPEIPMNAGCFEPIEVIAPTSTFLNAQYPRPVSGCAAEVSQRIVDTCFGALAQVVPERLHGAPVGTSANVALGGHNEQGEDRYILYFYTGGGHGGFVAGDGISNACTSVGLAKTPPLEVVEQYAPVLFEEYALRQDSGGAGAFRGGLGVQYSLRLLSGEGRMSVLGDRGQRGPFGVLGGRNGAPTRVSMRVNAQDYVPEMGTKDENVPFAAGDVIRVETPGGGGYGDPASRSRALISHDLANGYISEAFAARHYP
ncbi:hydantoinase B/oxoprolinase family protein [Bradyrhizobium sp. NP1]|uniref:hydantoinase B/oxoprolinase family protein n=1 Tax=Bradyrhizobium sp. NP1 TaxID=3049772 RepID=UPI0025A62C18|nr:hydantoinase B/oxoprolinase family protein [Bradyrhizobium sp. NP1]WJR77275.1 hydantoinase B/oxoprolinase family protein [Bradyrhizobium sp. NP1]